MVVILGLVTRVEIGHIRARIGLIAQLERDARGAWNFFNGLHYSQRSGDPLMLIGRIFAMGPKCPESLVFPTLELATKLGEVVRGKWAVVVDFGANSGGFGPGTYPTTG
jgi:hypothetical protein